MELSSLPDAARKNMPDWALELPCAVTVSDKNAHILYMNRKAIDTFSSRGGEELIGKSLYDCHSERSQLIIRKLLAEGGKNIYSIEKNGRKKLIFQSAWLNNGNVEGLVEISIEIPGDMPHFIRS